MTRIKRRETIPNDMKELRNFRRFLRLWPAYGYDMIQRPRWQKYLGLTSEEAATLVNNVNREIKR